MKRAQDARKQKQTPSAEAAAFVRLQRTADVLLRQVAALLKPAGVSPTQYNVLRILRGTPEGLPCGEIANRLITRDPDITRLLDRLERGGLITRRRQSRDRRMVLAQITAAGLALLAGLDQPLQELHRRQFQRVAARRLREFAAILELLREEEQ